MLALQQPDQAAVKLCECGCGEPAPLATRSDPGKGYVRGQPVRFIRNHHRRGVRHSPELEAALLERARSPEARERQRQNTPRGASHGRWRGGRYLGHDGYVQVGAGVHRYGSTGS
jgi:hypothetical protein